jgi:hypothetical protein
MTGTRRRWQTQLRLLLLGAAAVISGCDRQPPGNAAAPAAVASAPVAAAPVDSAPTASAAAALPAKPLDGVWRVIGVAVAADAPSVFGPDDAAMMGSEITVSPASLAWTRKASTDFTADDICNGPRAEPVAATTPAPDFAAALARFAADAAPGAVLHWVCTTGGSWGPDADDGVRLQRLGDNRLVMGWYDGVVLLLERGDGTR